MDNLDYNSIIGKNIRDIRKKHHLTQEEFAEQLDINAKFLSQVENGKSGISISNAINICNISNCSSTELFKNLIKSQNSIEKFNLLSTRDKSIINQMIDYLLNTK